MDNFQSFYSKKAFEISYAVFRLTGLMSQKNLARYLEDEALGLLAASSRDDLSQGRILLGSLEHFLRLGMEVNLVNQNNGLIVIAEARKLNVAIQDQISSAKLPDMDLESIFSREEDNHESGSMEAEADQTKGGFYSANFSKPDKEMVQVGKFGKSDFREQLGLLKSAVSGNAAKISLEDRSSLILDKIRQSGYCRLKDLQELLPGVSERTVRYDIQKLSEKELIERIGNGGPSTFYRIKRDVI